MKSGIFSLFILLLASFCLNAQSYSEEKYEEYYKDQLEEGERMVLAYATHIFVQKDDGQYINKVFYPEKKILTHFITCIVPGIKQGPYKEWYDNGHLLYEGEYVNNEKEGTWKYYPFSSTKEVQTGNYVKGKKEGLWIIQDSLGNTILEENYRNDYLQGAYKAYNNQGELAIERNYEYGGIVSEIIYRDDAVENMYSTVDMMPYIKGCSNTDLETQKECSDNKLLTAIYKNITYPEKARLEGIEGTAIISFTVDETGKMGEVITLRGISADIEKECLKVLESIPEWEAGEDDGEKIKIRFNLPVKFKLE